MLLFCNDLQLSKHATVSAELHALPLDGRFGDIITEWRGSSQGFAAARDFYPTHVGSGSFSTKFSGVCLWALPLSPKSGHSASAALLS